MSSKETQPQSVLTEAEIQRLIDQVSHDAAADASREVFGEPSSSEAVPKPSLADQVAQEILDTMNTAHGGEGAVAPEKPDESASTALPEVTPPTGESALATPDKAATTEKEPAKASTGGRNKSQRSRSKENGSDSDKAKKARKGAAKRRAKTSAAETDVTVGSPEPPHTAPAGDGVASSAENLSSGETFEISEGNKWSHAVTRDGATVTETIYIDSFDASSGLVHITESAGLVTAQREITKDALIQKLRDGDYRLSNSPLDSHAASEKAAVPSGESASEQTPLPSGEPAPAPSPDTPAPSSAESTPERAADLLRGRDPRNYAEVLPGDVWVLRTPNGEEIDTLTVKQILYGRTVNANSRWQGAPAVTDIEQLYEQTVSKNFDYEWNLSAFQQKLEIEGYVLVKAGEAVSSAESVERGMTDHEKEADPYATIQIGDVWELRNAEGDLEERVTVDDIYEKGIRKKQYVSLAYNHPVQGKLQPEELAKFQIRLRKNKFILLQRGRGDLETEEDKFIEDKAKAKEDLLGLPTEGETVRYTCPNGDLFVEFQPESKVYQVTYPTGEKKYYAETNLRRLAELEEWKKIGEVDENTPVVKYRFLLLSRNEKLYYRAENGSEFQVRKDPDAAGQYFLMALNTQAERPINEAELLELAEQNGWKELKQPELVDPEPWNDELVEKARQALRDARLNYTRVEAAQAGKWKWLKTMFRLKDEVPPELQEAWEAYQQAIITLQSLEIEQVKRGDFSEKELHEKIAGLIRTYEFQEGENLDDAKRQVRLKERAVALQEKWNQMWTPIKPQLAAERGQAEQLEAWVKLAWGASKIGGEALARGYQNLGEGWNKVMRTKGGKATMIVGGVAAGGIAVFFSGGAAATLAVAALAAKRAAAGAGIAVALEGAGDLAASELRKWKTERDANAFIEKEIGKAQKEKVLEKMAFGGESDQIGLKEIAPHVLEKLEAYLIDDINKRTYSKMLSRERGHLWRKTGAIFAGAVFGSGVIGQVFASEVPPRGGSGAVDRVAERLERGASAPAAATSAPETTASAPQGGASPTAHPTAEAASAPAPLSGASAAQMANASPEGGASAPGGARTLVTPDTHPPTDNRWPNIFNQAQFAHIPEAEWNGTTPDGAPGGPGAETPVGTESSSARQPLNTLLTDRTIRQGDTIWKFGVEAAQAAQLDASGQQRFSNLLTQTLREKLSMVSPAEAAKFGFYPNPDGLLTPDYIRADDKVNIVGLLGEEKVAKLIEQAQTGTTSSAVAQSAAEAIDPHKAYSSLQEAAHDAVKEHGRITDPFNTEYPTLKEAAQAAKLQYGVVEPTVASPGPSDRLLAFIHEHNLDGRNAAIENAMAEYVQTLGKTEQIRLTSHIRGILGPLLGYTEPMPLRQLMAEANTSMLRVLSDANYGTSTHALDTSQSRAIREWSQQSGTLLGQDMVQPLRGESVGKYVTRLSIIAHAESVALPLPQALVVHYPEEGVNG